MAAWLPMPHDPDAALAEVRLAVETARAETVRYTEPGDALETLLAKLENIIWGASGP